VQVILRCRPISKQEKTQRLQPVVKTCEATREVTVTQQIANKQIGRTFTFDRVFGTDTTQELVYDAAVSPIVKEVLGGFNCTMFAYGQTGTGKTYTMEGDISRNESNLLSESAGVIPRAIKQIFETLESAGSEYSVKVSYLELYNEKITDLLGIGDDQSDHQLCEDGRGGVVVRGLEDEIVKTSEEIYAVLEKGQARRRTAETKLNKESSRSHSVFTVTIHIKETTPEGDEMIKCGKLNLVDLAGSENISRSGAKKERAREAGEINKSLLTLGRVISALVERQSHVPYRDSKLTRLLRDSLGGKTKTCIIATIAPTAHCLDETLNTLDYAQRAKSIKNRPEVNSRISKHTLLKDLTVEIDRLKADLIATREKNGIYLSNTHYEGLLSTQKELEQQVQSLEAQIEEKEEELKNVKEMFMELETTHEDLSKVHEDTKKDLHDKIEELDETCEALEMAKTGIEERDYLITAQEQAEDRIVSHAIEITDSLTTTADETYKLHDKLERKTAVEKTIVATVKDLQALSSQQISNIEQMTNQNSKTQNKLLQKSSKEIEKLLTEQDENIDTLNSKLLHMKDNMEVFASKAVGIAQEEFTVKTLEMLNDISEMQDCKSKSTIDAGQKTLDSTTKNISMVGDAVEKSKSLLESYSSKQKENTSTMISQSNQICETADTVLLQIKSTTDSCQQEVATAFDSLKSKLNKARERMLESLTGQQEEMISSLTQAITESVNNQKVVVESFFSEMTGEVDASFEQTNGTLDSVEKTAEVGKDQLLSMQEQHTKELKKNEKAISKIEKSFGKSLEKCDDLCTEATETVQTDIASAAESEEKHTQEIGALLENAQSSIKEAVAAIEECVASGQAGLEESISDVKDTLTDTANKERESLQKVSDISAEQAKCLNEGSKSSMDLVSELGETIKEHASNVKPDLATGQTPAKRTIELPKNGFLQSLCTPAPEVVLEEYRNQKESRGTQTPTKDNQRKEETTEDDLEDAADVKENEEGVEATPTKGDLSLTSTESERQPLSSVINSPSMAAA
jgi:kinesin family protein 11